LQLRALSEHHERLAHSEEVSRDLNDHALSLAPARKAIDLELNVAVHCLRESGCRQGWVDRE
jgi:hypothetical protein